MNRETRILTSYGGNAESSVVRLVINPALSDRVTRRAHQIIDGVQTRMSSGSGQSPVSWRTSPPKT